MKTRKHHIVYLLTMLVMLAGLTACSKKVADSEEENSMSYVPQYSQYEYSFDSMKEVYSDFYGMYIQGNKLYIISRTNPGKGMLRDTLNVLDMSTGGHSDRLLGLAGSYFRTPNGFVGYSSGMLTFYDGSFDSTGKVDLTDFVRERKSDKGYFSYDYITADDSGNIAVISDNVLYLLDENGIQKWKTECPSNMWKMHKVFATNSGSWYVLCSSSGFNTYTFYKLDIKSGVLDEEPQNTIQGLEGEVEDICLVDSDDFYIYTENYVYRYFAKDSRCEKLICLRDYGVEIGNEFSAGGVKKGFGLLEGDVPGILLRGNDSTDDGQDVRGVELVTLVPADENATGRTELVAASITEPTYTERAAIMRFNKYNPDYYITIKVYADMEYNTEDSQEKYKLAQQSFNNDLVSGKGADIYISYQGKLDFINLAKKGALVDLYELIDADEDISRDDFVQSVLKAMEYNGKLYTMIPFFSIYTIAGKKSLLEQYDKWDFNAIYDLTSKHPDSILFMNSTQERNFTTLTAYALDMFYDRETAECHFDSEQFIKLLEVVKNGGTEYDQTADLGELLTGESVLLYETSLIPWYELQLLPYYFGGDMTFAGYPSKEEKSETAFSFHYEWSISEQSQHREGAWQFIKSLFDDEYQRINFEYPVIKTSFENMIAEAKKFNEELRVEVAKGARVYVHAMTDEEADELRAIIDNTMLTYRPDKAVYDIVLEEVQSYFAGARSVEDTVAIIQNRVKLYLEENN